MTATAHSPNQHDTTPSASPSNSATSATSIQDQVDRHNEALRESYDSLPWSDPVGLVQWIHVDRVHPNTWNPNSVAHTEMELLHTSIDEDGYTQPVVTMYDEESDRYTIVDGYHRYTTMVRYADIWEKTQGYLPVVVIDKPIEDRIASTVRHNRARGEHSVDGMGNLVMQMLNEGVTDAEICRKLGLGAEELARLKHITGFSKLFANANYSTPVLTEAQLRAKVEYKKAHPNEEIPNEF